MMRSVYFVLASLCVFSNSAAMAIDTSTGTDKGTSLARIAQQYRPRGVVTPVGPINDPIILEAEEFAVHTPGWEAVNWGDNYFAASASNTFLSRQAALCAPQQCSTDSVAELLVPIATTGRYAVLVRYEAAFRFETQFRIELEQNGHLLLSHTMGTRDAVRIWAFGKGLTEEAQWPQGANENMVWEGHDVLADMAEGPLRVRLVAAQQPGPAARRIIDAIILTTNITGVAERIKHEKGLPLDGWLTQAGDVYLRPWNRSDAPVAFTIWPGSERSPAAIHFRTWQPLNISVDSRRIPSWLEAGHLLDTLNDGLWHISVDSLPESKTPLLAIEFGIVKGDGSIQSMRTIGLTSNRLDIVYRGALRYDRRIITRTEAEQAFERTVIASAPPSAPLREVYGHGAAPLLAHLGIHDSSVLPSTNLILFHDIELGSPRGSPQWLEWGLDSARNEGRFLKGKQLIAKTPIDDPGMTPADWRRRMYATLAHGATGFDLGDLFPAPLRKEAGGFESPGRWTIPLTHMLNEYGRCQEMLLQSEIKSDPVALFVGKTGKRWNNGRPPFKSALQCLAVALRHQHITFDVIDETALDHHTLSNYTTIYLSDSHVDSTTTSNLLAWVTAGGHLFLTAGAGWRDEHNQLNYTFHRHMGITVRDLQSPRSQAVEYEKQDLPFLKPMEWIYATNRDSSVVKRNDGMPIFGVRARFITRTAAAIASFSDKSPALVVNKVGRGSIITCAFLPGLTYFKSALPLRPVDRGGNDYSYDHFLPTQFDWRAARLISIPLEGITHRVLSSNPLVETALIESPSGYLIPVINWTPSSHSNFSVRFNSMENFSSMTLASRSPLHVTTNKESLIFAFDLGVADALILRRR